MAKLPIGTYYGPMGFVIPTPALLFFLLKNTPNENTLFLKNIHNENVTPWNFDNLKFMFNVILVLFDWYGWVEVLCELATCDCLMWMLGYVKFDWLMLKLWDFKFYLNLF